MKCFPESVKKALVTSKSSAFCIGLPLHTAWPCDWQLCLRHHRWPSCLPNAVLAISNAFYHVHKTKLPIVSKQTLLVSVVTGISNYHAWIHQHHKCEKYWQEKVFLKLLRKYNKDSDGGFLSIYVSVLKKMAFSELHCGSLLEVYLTCQEKQNNNFSRDYCILINNAGQWGLYLIRNKEVSDFKTSRWFSHVFHQDKYLSRKYRCAYLLLLLSFSCTNKKFSQKSGNGVDSVLVWFGFLILFL